MPEPPTEGDEGYIGRKAIWSLDELKSIVQASTAERSTWKAVTRKCKNDLKRLMAEGGFDLAQHIAKLTERNYDKSKWCLSSPVDKTPGFWLPCDAYTVNAHFTHPDTGWESTVNYYLKMAKAVDGSLVLFVSIHP